MKKLSFLMIFVVCSLFADEFKIPKYHNIITGEMVDCTEVYNRMQKKEKIECDFDFRKFPSAVVLKMQDDCECKSRIFEMPGGGGHLDRIIGKDPKTGKVEPYYRDVTKEEAEMIRAKNAYKKASKDVEVAKNKLEKAKSKKDESAIKQRQEKLDEAIRDAELSKAKIKDLEEIAKENKKEQ